MPGRTSLALNLSAPLHLGDLVHQGVEASMEPGRAAGAQYSKACGKKRGSPLHRGRWGKLKP